MLVDLKEFNPKKTSLIAHWIKSYTHYIRNEDKFVSNGNYKLKRGHIIQVDFGFRLGKELGGLHYAVVLDNSNKLHSPLITVVPLTSLKERYKPNNYTKKLEDGIYSSCLLKLTKQLETNKKLVNETIALTENLRSGYISQYGNSNVIDQYFNSVKISKYNIELLNNQIKEIEYLKEGSVACVSQITTISKMRIKRPLKKEDLLYNVRLSINDMQIINEAIKKDYIFYK